MLLQFHVENFASIKGPLTLSMVAGADHTHEETLISFGKERLQPGVIMYGANAAGKTNIIRAMSAAIMLIRESNTRQITDRLTRVVPFLFDDSSAKNPTSFDFIIVADGVKYQYGFSADNSRIIDEYLYAYKSAKPSLLFERTNTDQYRYTEKEAASFRIYEEKNTQNKLFLATATSWNCKETEPVFRWFANRIEVVDGRSLEALSMPYYMDEDDEQRRYVSKMLQIADLGIYGYEVTTEEVSIEEIQNEPPRANVHSLQRVEEGKATELRKASIYTFHKVNHGGRDDVYALPLQIESEGTKRLFYMGPIIKRVLDKGTVIAVDEMDASFHPFLINYLISLFRDK